MPGPKNESTSRPDRQSATIGGLMWIVLGVALYLAYFRSTFNGLVGLAVFYALVFAYVWIVALSTVRRTHWAAADTAFEVFDPQAEETPKSVKSSIQETAPLVQALGFRALGHFRAPRPVVNSTTFVTLFENRAARQTANLFTGIIENRDRRRVVYFLAFTTAFSDGTLLVTANNVEPRTLPPLRIREGSMAFPRIRDPRRLYEIHSACVARFAGDAIALEPATRDPAEFLRESFRKETTKFVETGYYYLDEIDQVYRLTWKGAILIVWKTRWPVKQIRALSRRYRGARLLRELGLDP